ncbi:MAG TPA: penicillin acylase family protein [Polyangiaceae bacterium]|nr:penicillin acylase family protein [Polyangiaceae bacterium]
MRRRRSGTGVQALKLRALILSLSAFALVPVCGYWWLCRSRPELSGSSQAHGLKHTAAVDTDQEGLVTVRAASAEDAYVALGFAHARDRLWQMELTRRAARGTLSEAFGAKLVRSDRWMRTLGFTEVCEQNFRVLSLEARTVLEKYAEGVNAFLKLGRPLPPEFALFSVTPEAWSSLDSLLTLKLMAWSLSGNFWDELVNVRLLAALPLARALDLAPVPTGEPERIIEALDGDEIGELEPVARALFDAAPAGAAPGVGSNAWVVDGLHTQSGKPLLASDPHLMLSAPAVWYLARLESPEVEVAGATIPGLPTVVLGHNGHVAWGYTNTRPDTQDLFIERLDAERPDHYVTPEGSAPFVSRMETIHIKGEPDLKFEVRATRHGPVISDADDGVRRAMPKGRVLALAWVTLRDDDQSFEFSVKAARARRAAELLEAARFFHSPQESLVFADIEGQVGYVVAGRVPLRAPSNIVKGRLPAAGWQRDSDWQGFIPFEALPQGLGAPSGKIVTANQRVTPANYPFWMTANWASAERAHRISALLERAPSSHTLETFAAIQLDDREPGVLDLVAHFTRMRAMTSEQAHLITALRAWDGSMAPDRLEPLLFAEWSRRFTLALYARKLRDLSDILDEYHPEFLRRVFAVPAATEYWCAPGQPVPCEAELRSALQEAQLWIVSHYGSEPKSWSWGKANMARFAHRSLGRIPLLSKLFSVEVPRGGGYESVNVSGYFFDRAADGYVTESGPGFRALYDLSDLSRSRFMLGPGQAGHPLSPFYSNLAQPWASGGYVVFGRSRAQSWVLEPEPRSLAVP